MRPLLLMLINFFSSAASGQDQKKLIGVWKLIALNDDEMYYNFKKDSIFFDKKMEGDTSMARALLAMSLSQMGTVLYTYDKNGHFAEKTGDTVNGEGSYVVDTKKSIITLKGRRNNYPFTEQIEFKFKDGFLLLKTHKDDDMLVLTLEKQK
jgi:hypothetical protein